jgi:hypothetical protein
MTNNIQPLYSGGDPSFPLSPAPYYSRTEDKNVNFIDDGLPEYGNYKSLAFRPGFSLQASELNEIQENFQLQMSLTISMMHNWITSGAGSLWMPWEHNSPGGEGGAWTANNHPPVAIQTGIGVGGGADGAGHSQEKVVSGPGWRGATPLHPFKSPYQQPNNTSNMNSVFVSGLVNNRLTFTFNPGWWLVEDKGHWAGEDMPEGVSGLKHWIYLKTPIVSDDINVSTSIGRYITVGLKLETSYVECGTNPIDGDEELADNATGIPNSASCGASRYSVNFLGDIQETNAVVSVAIPDANSDWSVNHPDFVIRENMNPVCVVDTTDKEVRYMNNLLITTY